LRSAVVERRNQILPDALTIQYQAWRTDMANPTQPKVKPATYSGLDSDNQFNDDRVRMQPVAAKSSSTTTVLVVLALAVIAALAYFYLGDSRTDTTVTSPAVTQETAPAPATPPGETVQDPVPTTPAPVTPAPVTPAPAAPAN
jgi:hypothetical protein